MKQHKFPGRSYEDLSEEERRLKPRFPGRDYDPKVDGELEDTQEVEELEGEGVPEEDTPTPQRTPTTWRSPNQQRRRDRQEELSKTEEQPRKPRMSPGGILEDLKFVGQSIQEVGRDAAGYFYNRPEALAREAAGGFQEARRSLTGGLALPTLQSTNDLRNFVRDQVGLGLSEEEKMEQQAALAGVMSFAGAVNPRLEFDEDRGEYRALVDTPESFVGMVAPYVVGVTATAPRILSLLPKGMPAAAKLMAAGGGSSAIVDQALSDPYWDNIFDLAQDILDPEHQNDILEFLATDDRDSEAARRLKMLGQEQVFNVLFSGTVMGVKWLNRTSQEIKSKVKERGFDNLTPDEKGEVVLDVIQSYRDPDAPVTDYVPSVQFEDIPRPGPVREADQFTPSVGDMDIPSPGSIDETPRVTRLTPEDVEGPATGGTFTPSMQEGDIPRPGPVSEPIEFTTRPFTPEDVNPTTTESGAFVGGREGRTFQETADGLRQVEAQTGSGFKPHLTRIWQQVTQARGYWTEEAFKLHQTSQSEQRAMLQRGENIAARLQHRMDAVIRESEDPSILNSVAEALSNPDKELREQVFNSLSPELQQSVTEARGYIDNLSREVLLNPTIGQQFKDSVAANYGSYLRRSFQAWEKQGFKPTSEARREAEEFFAHRILNSRAGGYAEINTWEEAITQAKNEVDQVLKKPEDQGFQQFSANVDRVRKAFFEKKDKDLAPEIRNLLGEVQNPADNIVLTAAKLTDFVYSSKFYQEFEQLGIGKYLSTEPTEKFNTRVTGTGSQLDFVARDDGLTGAASGYYTTPEIARALAGRQSHLDLYDNEIFRQMAYLKGMSQQMKTVYSHPVHMRNFMGGLFFRLNNGYLPMSPQHSERTREVLWNKLRNAGDETLEQMYEDYLRLGIINTNTKVNEFRELIQRGSIREDALGDYFINQVSKIGDTAESGARALVRGPEQIYMGTDDFFKITAFEDYLDTLRRALPEESEEVLRARAADVIRNTIPNYDLVPPGVKALRNIPFISNFAGFSSEVIRNSYHTIKIGFDELASGNDILMERGIRRLEGFMVASGGGIDLIASTTQSVAGFNTEEKRRAFREESQTNFTKSSNPLAMIGEDGEIYSVDLSYINPYSYTRDIVAEFIGEVLAGNREAKDFDETFFKASWEGLKAVVGPYMSESILNEVVMDVTQAIRNPDGRTASGQTLLTPGMSGIEKTMAVAEKLWSAFEPGTITAFRNLRAAETGERRGALGRERDLQEETFAFSTGVRPKKIDMEERVRQQSLTYISDIGNNISLTPRWDDTPESVMDHYKAINYNRYRSQQKLYKTVVNAELLGMPKHLIRNQLNEAGLTSEVAGNIMIGRFTPYTPNEDTIKVLKDRVFPGPGGLQASKEYINFASEMSRLSLALRGISLSTLEEEEQPNFLRMGVDRSEGTRILRRGE